MKLIINLEFHKFDFQYIIILILFMNSQQGVVPIRLLRNEEIQTLKNSHEVLKQKLKQIRRQKIHWLNVYVNRKLINPVSIYQEALEKLVKDLLDQMFKGQEVQLNSYGFMNNPIQNKNFQQWHIDYNRNVYTIFIPMVDINTKNSIQFIRQNIKFDGIYSQQQNKQFHYYGYDDNLILQKQGILFYEVSQIVCRPFTILKMLNNTIHRGIPNSAGVDRLIFYIVCSIGGKSILNQQGIGYH